MIKFLCFTTLVISSHLLYAQSDNAIHFDNIDDHITAPGASLLIANNQNISMTMWVYPENQAPVYPDYDGFAGFRNNSNADFYILQLTATGVEARFRGNTGVATDILFSSLQLNTWQHFALTYDGSTLSLYHNGMLAQTAAASGVIAAPTNDPFLIGMLPWTGADFYMNGRIDEVSLWNKTLTPAEIECIYTGAIDPSDSNVQLYYKCNQGTAGGNNSGIPNLIDSKGNINGNFNGFSLNGNTSNFVTGVVTSNASSLNDILCPGATYLFGSQTITLPGTYVELFPSSVGGNCDSIVTLTLVSPNINTSVSQAGPVLLSQQAGAAYQWIDCQNGNLPLPGETNQSFTATVNGQYAVVVTVDGCSDTSVCVTVTGVGIHEVNNTLMEIGPNPFIDELVIRNNNVSSLSINVYDITGKLLFKFEIESGNNIHIPTKEWKSGIYLITNDSNDLSMKLLKR